MYAIYFTIEWNTTEIELDLMPEAKFGVNNVVAEKVFGCKIHTLAEDSTKIQSSQNYNFASLCD